MVREFRIFGTLLGLLIAVTLPALGQSASHGGDQGFAMPAQQVVLDSLPQQTEAEIAAQPVHSRRPLDGFTDAQRQARKQALIEKTTGSSNGNAGPDGGNGIYSVGLTKGFPGVAEGSLTPSDMALAVGPKYVLQAVNTSLLVTDKTGVVQLGYPKSLQSFFGLSASTYVTDPRAFYDWSNNRYVVVMLTETLAASGNQGFLLLAASQTNDPRGAWWNYGKVFQIGATGECPDYPTLGNDHTPWIGEAGGNKKGNGGIYVGINQFSNCSPSGSLIQNYVFFLPKTAIYKGLGFSYWFEFGFFDPRSGILLDTLQPDNVTTASNNPAAIYLVASDNIRFAGGQCFFGCNGLVVWAVTNPFGFISGGPSPEFSVTTLPTRFNYFLSTGADEPGCNNCIETIDTRISGSMQYNAGELFGSLETQDPLFGTGQNSPIWFELHPVLGALNTRCTGVYAKACADIAAVEERNEDCFFCGGWRGHGSGYFATLQPDPENNIVMVYNFSSRNAGDYPGTAFTSRRTSQANNTMNGAGFYLANGAGLYLQGRWGDYTGTAADLAAASQPYMWFSGMYSTAIGNWATQIGKAGYTLPTQF
jgi:hypothetical protein